MIVLFWKKSTTLSDFMKLRMQNSGNGVARSEKMNNVDLQNFCSKNFQFLGSAESEWNTKVSYNIAYCQS